MKHLLQILFLLWFTNTVNATPIFTSISVSSYENSILAVKNTTTTAYHSNHQQIQSFLRVLEVATLGGDILYGKIAKAKAGDLYANHFDEISDVELKI